VDIVEHDDDEGLKVTDPQRSIAYVLKEKEGRKGRETVKGSG